MSRTDARLAELLGAAAADDLSQDERSELEAWAADDPAVRAELDATLGIVSRIDGLVVWDDGPPPWLDVLSAPPAPSAARGSSAHAAPRGRGRVGLAVAAVALVAVGAGGTVAVQSVTGAPPQGGPGTLGAEEPVAFEPDSDPAEVDATLVAHSWGTEAVLTVDGLEPGQTYDVYFLDAEGREVSAGAFLGSEATIDCRLNAAVMREQVTSLRIEQADGSVVRSADLPSVPS